MPTFTEGAANFKTDLKKITANSFLAGLQQLKESGASLPGSLSNIEGEKVQSANYNFSPQQNEESFTRELARYKSDISSSLENTINKFNETYGTNFTADGISKRAGASRLQVSIPDTSQANGNSVNTQNMTLEQKKAYALKFYSQEEINKHLGGQ